MNMRDASESHMNIRERITNNIYVRSIIGLIQKHRDPSVYIGISHHDWLTESSSHGRRRERTREDEDHVQMGQQQRPFLLFRSPVLSPLCQPLDLFHDDMCG